MSHAPPPDPRSGTALPRRPGEGRGVRILGTGSSVPDKKLTNADLERVMDTSDEWIVQRTGIRERRIVDPAKGECTLSLGTAALTTALANAKIPATELDLVILSTMTPEMPCPPTACRLAAQAGASRAAAFDLSGACCGYVLGLNVAHEMIRGGLYRTVALVGGDVLSTLMDYSTAGRGTSIIFGDAAAAIILQRADDPSKGIIAQSMHTDGTRWKEIYVPQRERDFPPGADVSQAKLGHVQMNGSSVFKFAVGTFPDLIQETLDKAALKPDDVDMYVCHQSNARILIAARDRFGVPEDRFYININRYGNTVAASVPLCFDELWKAGRVKPGHKVMFVAFGGGLTWASSLWQL